MTTQSAAEMGGKEIFDEMLPDDLPPSRPRLALVAGSPGAGKSTFVRTYAKPGDEIIDADDDAARLGFSRFTTDPDEVLQLLRSRNERLRGLARSSARRAWFTFTGAKVSTRWHFIKLLKPVRCYVVIAGSKAPLITCINRIERTRPGASPAMYEAARRWHKNYEPHRSDIIVYSA